MPTPRRLQHSSNFHKNQHLASQTLVSLSLAGPGWERWPLDVPPGRGCWQHTPEAGTALLQLAHLQVTLGISQGGELLKLLEEKECWGQRMSQLRTRTMDQLGGLRNKVKALCRCRYTLSRCQLWRTAQQSQISSQKEQQEGTYKNRCHGSTFLFCWLNASHSTPLVLISFFPMKTVEH